MNNVPPNDENLSTAADPIGRDPLDVAPLRIGILLWPAFPMMSLTCIVESLRHAGDHGDASRHRYAEWEILGAPGTRTTSSCGISIEATAPYSEPGAFHFVFVIGGLLKDLDDVTPGHLTFLRAAARSDTTLVGACTGVFVLAREGLLDGRPACVHPYHDRDFEEAFPGHRRVRDADYAVQDRKITVLGGVSMLSLMTKIVRDHFGPDRAAKVVYQTTLSAGGQPDPKEWSPSLPDASITDPRIRKALVVLDAQASETPRIAELARSLGLSERHFLRLFREQVGRAPMEYLIETKLRIAVWMLQRTSRSVTSVAYAAGFSSGANLADHCRRHFGKTPSEIRSDANV